MKNIHINKILYEYEKTRDKAIKEYEERKREIYSFVPRIKEIEVEMAKVSISSSKKIFENPEKQEGILRDTEILIKKLQQEKAFLLTENNIPLVYMEIHYNCKFCKDTGFLKNGEKCSCFVQKMLNEAYKMSNLNDILERENFSTFNLDLFSKSPFEDEATTPWENMKNILNESLKFTRDFDKKYENLLFYGSTGLGKTFLCNSIAKELLDKGKIVVYQTSFKILEILEKKKFSKVIDPIDDFSYDMLFSSDLLIIDDLGTEMNNTFTNSEIFNIINTRLLEKKNMIISTNLTPIEIKKIYSDRISSRIFGNFKIIDFFGPDIRWESKVE